jgi:predicted DNA-binding protein
MIGHNGRLKRLISQVIEPLTIHIWPCIVSRMARKKISTTIYITPEQSERLKELHDKTKVPVAEFIRQGIDMVLERESRHLAGQLTLDMLAPRQRG